MSGLVPGGDIGPKRRENPLERKQARRAANTRVSVDQIVSRCREGATLDEIAADLGITRTAAARQIERLLRRTPDIDVDRLIGSELRGTIEEAFENLQTTSIKRIAASLNGHASEAEIRIVRGYLMRKFADLDE